jgi:peroxin-14
MLQKYLLPHLKPPTSTAYEADRDALTAQFDAAEALLKEMQVETNAVKTASEDQKAKVDQATADVEAAVKEMREGEDRTRDEMREIRQEVDTIQEMLPKARLSSIDSTVHSLLTYVQMLEKNKEAQAQSLAELQQELKSLKTLLLSRGPSVSGTATPPLPGLSSRPSIPAWQLAAAEPANPLTQPPPIASGDDSKLPNSLDPGGNLNGVNSEAPSSST